MLLLLLVASPVQVPAIRRIAQGSFTRSEHKRQHTYEENEAQALAHASIVHVAENWGS